MTENVRTNDDAAQKRADPVEHPYGNAAADAGASAGAGATEDAGSVASSDAPVDVDEVREAVVKALKTVFDPEITVNIYDLGLIYEVNVKEDGHVHVLMTLTTPNCFAAQSLPGEAQAKAAAVPGVKAVKLDVTFDPPWSMDMMSDAVKLQLGML